MIVSTVPATAPALAAGPGGCADTSVPLSVEEQRLAGAVPQEIVRRAGFDSVASQFARALCGAGSYREAEKVITTHGQRLWRRAVDRAQGRGASGGDLSRDDDRPLYWARLGMTGALRQWRPAFDLTDAGRG